MTTLDPKALEAATTEERWPRKGDKMRFLDCNGYDHQLAEARSLFSKGQELTVIDCCVGDWSHSIQFEEHPGWFNGVMFEFADGTS